MVEAEFALSRGHGCPMETRGILCQYDGPAGVLTTWSSTQVPHGLRSTLSDKLHLALERAQYDRLRAEQAQARAVWRLLGIGLACYVESCSIGMPDGARAWLGENGQVTVAVGAPGQGQGHRTIWARLAAAALGLAPAAVEVISGDTGLVRQGTGTFGSRSATVTGNAVHAAAGDLARQIRTAAARMLECSPDDVELAAGQAAVRGVPGRAMPYARLAAHLSAATPGGPVLEASADWVNKAGTWSGGCHLAVVEVEPQTGEVRVIWYVVAHDSGRILDDQMAAGQVTGGVVQGIGGCLYEHLAYDDQGQPLAATLADYLVPPAVEAPPVDVVHLETPAPGNPLGLKGLGETGIMGPYAAVASAVEDALRPLGIAVDALPLSPARVAGWLRQ